MSLMQTISVHDVTRVDIKEIRMLDEDTQVRHIVIETISGNIDITLFSRKAEYLEIKKEISF